jgi:hydroxypyruvate reductase
MRGEALLRAMFDAAVEAARAPDAIAKALPVPPVGKTLVLGAGKASGHMAETVERLWSGPLAGLVVTQEGYARPCERIEVVEASHPTPDRAGAAAAARILEMVRGLSFDDLVLCLISGGGSALLPVPAGRVSLEDKQAITRALLRSGATIHEINCVRKHLSRIKGGRLAAACQPARVVSLIVSDVPGDDVAVIASGPTAPDATTREEAGAVLARYGVPIPATVNAWLASPDAETPKPGDPLFARVNNIIVATPQMALEAAADVARGAGFTSMILGDAIEGEAREVGRAFAGIAHEVLRHGGPARPPCALISGGETTVTVRGDGRGGRNVEFALGLALGLGDVAGVSALAADTDGIDGAAGGAGALVLPETLARARARGIDPRAALDRNDAGGFFAALGQLFQTGPTFTNVNDLRIILIEARS